MNKNVRLLREISTYVISLFLQYHGNDLLYHNLKHTKSVVKRGLEIAVNYAFSENELFILSAAAWFHDIGHLVGGVKLHEFRSVIIMQNFLVERRLSKDIIDKIKSCIYATKIPNRPKSFLEEIICDADTYNLGTKDFFKNDKLLKKEYQLRNISVDKWDQKTLKLLLRHKYFTPYCQVLLNNGKQKNVSLVKDRLHG